MGRSAWLWDGVLHCGVFRADIRRSEPCHTGRYRPRFRSADLGSAILYESIFRCAIPCTGIRRCAIERGTVVCSTCFCGLRRFSGFVCFDAGNEYADVAGSFAIAREFGADSRGGA
jgi:hypothetical protein